MTNGRRAQRERDERARFLKDAKTDNDENLSWRFFWSPRIPVRDDGGDWRLVFRDGVSRRTLRCLYLLSRLVLLLEEFQSSGPTTATDTAIARRTRYGYRSFSLPKQCFSLVAALHPVAAVGQNRRCCPAAFTYP